MWGGTFVVKTEIFLLYQEEKLGLCSSVKKMKQFEFLNMWEMCEERVGVLHFNGPINQEEKKKHAFADALDGFSLLKVSSILFANIKGHASLIHY